MKKRIFLIPAFLILLIFGANSQPLKIVTLNLWTGLDYHGNFSIGEYESLAVREMRLRMVEEMLRTTRPDIVSLQEANPVNQIAQRIAEACDYDFLYQRVNSGLKIGSLGLPWNLNEGIVILARKGLRLEFVDVWSLSKSLGVIGNIVSLQTAEDDIALVARINVQGVPITLINIHAVAVVPVDSVNSASHDQILAKMHGSSVHRDRVAKDYEEKADEIRQQLDRLSDHITATDPKTPTIVMGDFNASPNSVAMREFLLGAHLFDAADASDAGSIVTWDAERNRNTSYSRDSLDARGGLLSPLELLGASYDGRSRRIDYVLLNRAFEERDVRKTGILLDSAQGGLFASDHYGFLAEISTDRLLSAQPMVSDSVEAVEGSTTEPFPILSYDTDVGFGYGAKVFMLNPFGGNESFDVTLFNSTKGERWYRFVCSVPDLEVRQGRLYPLAVDLVVDYDKYLKNSFFGVGNGSEFKSREYYTREPLEISLAFSSGFSRRAVGQIGLKYKSVRNFNFPDTSRLVMVSPALNSATARYHSLFASYRYDSRNSFVNPSRGWVLQAEGEFAPQTGLTNVQLGRLAGWVQYYSVLFYPKTVLALRLGMQGLIGNNVPVQMLLSIGGNQTLRGSPQDRYLDKTASISNAEVRFPIFWRFGGIIGYDAGKVWRELSDVSLSRWAANPVVGLRFFMETFVVRMDLGFGTETTGFYLNFGHLF